MLRIRSLRRFRDARANTQVLVFLIDNCPDNTSHRFRLFVLALGLVSTGAVCAGLS